MNLLTHAVGGDPSNAAYVALCFSILLLTAVGYLGARRAGSTGAGAIAEALGTGLLGVLSIAAKALLH